jgi:hypothetical protein
VDTDDTLLFTVVILEFDDIEDDNDLQLFDIELLSDESSDVNVEFTFCNFVFNDNMLLQSYKYTNV